eukprot:scaffold218615_cov30-Tisochrysis_lutea.AAC.4
MGFAGFAPPLRSIRSAPRLAVAPPRRPRRHRAGRRCRRPFQSFQAPEAPSRYRWELGNTQYPARCAGQTIACRRTRLAASGALARCMRGPAGRWRWAAPRWRPARRRASTSGWASPTAPQPAPWSYHTGYPRSSHDGPP